jgi:hypothetical protein
VKNVGEGPWCAVAIEATTGQYLFQHLMMLLNQLKLAIELSNLLQVQHTAAQNTISALKFKVISLETLVKSQAAAATSPPTSRTQASIIQVSHPNTVQLERASQRAVVICTRRKGIKT